MGVILEIIVFTSGGVLLVLEIIASRVLAPFFDNSIYVWGSLIGVFLAALSVGYAVGGRLADRYPSPGLFAGIVFLAGLLTVPIPLIAGPVLEAIARADFGPQLNPLMGALALFVIPSIIMGMVSPFAVRLKARAVGTMGQTAGNLYAISTVGSIVGTLVASFILINFLGVRAIILICGITLMVMAALGWLAAGRRSAAAASVVAAVLFGAAIARATPALPPSMIFQKDTVYHRITVSDEGAVRYLKLDNYWQSALDREQPERTVFAYADYMHLPLIFVREPKRAIMIGMGGGTLPARYVSDYPSVTMDVAEIDPRVIDAARDYFGVEVGGRLKATARDGRLHLRLASESQDIILTDAYLIDTIPFHLATREFFTLVRARLMTGGVLTSNIIGALDGPDSKLFRAIYKSITQVFPTVYVFPVDYGKFGSPSSLRNIIVIATDAPRLSRHEIERRAQGLVDAKVVTVDRFLAAAADLYEPAVRVNDVPALSDDYAPIDMLIPPR